MKMEGKIIAKSLGQAETTMAPVLIEPVGRGEGGTVTVSGDFKVRFDSSRGQGGWDI